MAQKNYWSAQQLRISIFPTSTWNASVDLWPQVTGTEKEKETTNSKTGEIIQEGWYNKQKLVLAVNPVKIDLILTVSIPAHIEKGETIVDTLGSLDEALKVFQSLVNMWLLNKQLPEVNRLAFGAQLIKIMPSREAVYKELAGYTPINLNPTIMTDFKFEINLLTKSKIFKTLGLNRLTKWGALQLTPEASIVGQSVPVHKYPTINFARVELDINTSQHNKDILDKKILSSLYSELIGLGYELSVEGVLKYVK
ncbi:MAG: hypothetical protein AAB492_02830 [Patescibacteria group bacterium]